MDLVSIIMPYHKKKEYIKSAILSVLNQTYQNFEIYIIFDDEDIDDLPFINEIVTLDNRINLIVNKSNLGAGESRNLAIMRCGGNFIAFLDCDDWWHPNKLEFQINFMNVNNFLFTHTSYNIIDKDDKIIGCRQSKSVIDFLYLLKSCDIGLSTVVIKKNLLSMDICFPNLTTKEDYVLWLRLAQKGYKIYGIDKIFTNWRKTKNSLSSSNFQKIVDGYKVYNQYMSFGYIKSILYLFRLSINALKKNK